MALNGSGSRHTAGARTTPNIEVVGDFVSYFTIFSLSGTRTANKMFSPKRKIIALLIERPERQQNRYSKTLRGIMNTEGTSRLAPLKAYGGAIIMAASALLVANYHVEIAQSTLVKIA